MRVAEVALVSLFEQYVTIHRFETNRLRNIAKFFGHLFYTDALDWAALAYIKLNEEETTSSSRIFIKILFRVRPRREQCMWMLIIALNEGNVGADGSAEAQSAPRGPVHGVALPRLVPARSPQEHSVRSYLAGTCN